MAYALAVISPAPALPEASVDAFAAVLREHGDVVPLSLVLAHVRPAYGGATWAEALAYLHGDPAEAEVIAALTIALEASGGTVFDSPIRVFVAEPDDRPEDRVCDAVPDPAGSEWVIGNGMHRVAAAVAMGSPAIRVTTATQSGNDPLAEEYVEVEFTFTGGFGWETADYDALDFVCGWLRSFPLPDGTWVEGDSFGSRGLVFSGLWSCPTRHADVLLAELQARFSRHAPPAAGDMRFVSWRTCTGADLDAEYAALGIDLSD